MNKEIVLFKKDGKDYTFEDILLKIYENAEEKKVNIQATAKHITDKIQTTADAVILMPQLISLQEIAIRNDDAIVKMAAIVSRNLGKVKTKFNLESDLGISPEERKQLLAQATEIRNKNVPGQSAGDE